MLRAVFPGSFDPFTVGHEDILLRALPLFNEVVIAIGVNSAKKTLFSLEKRIDLLNKLYENEPKVTIESYSGLTARYCSERGISHIIRGLRSGTDFEYEKSISQLNTAISPDLETIFLISSPHLSHVSSSIVREIMINKGDARQFLPEKIRDLV